MILKETIDGKEINVIKSSGYNDGYYWDMNAMVIFDGSMYTIIDGGSRSGWDLCYTGVKKGKLDRLYNHEHEQLENLDELKDFIDEIPELLRKFINSGAKESWEDIQDEDYRYHTSVDGKEVIIHYMNWRIDIYDERRNG